MRSFPFVPFLSIFLVLFFPAWLAILLTLFIVFRFRTPSLFLITGILFDVFYGLPLARLFLTRGFYTVVGSFLYVGYYALITWTRHELLPSNRPR